MEILTAYAHSGRIDKTFINVWTYFMDGAMLTGISMSTTTHETILHYTRIYSLAEKGWYHLLIHGRILVKLIQ